MSQTGGLSTFFPLIALTSSGSSAVPATVASATASEIHRATHQIFGQTAQWASRGGGGSPPTALQRTEGSGRREGPARADRRRREVDGSESGGHAVAIGGWWGEAAAGWGGWRRPRLPESRSGWGISGFGMRLCAFADNSGRATAVGVSVSDIQMGQWSEPVWAILIISVRASGCPACYGYFNGSIQAKKKESSTVYFENPPPHHRLNCPSSNPLAAGLVGIARGEKPGLWVQFLNKNSYFIRLV
jgi:hypothetical protein